jgi:hypothetical protein
MPVRCLRFAAISLVSIIFSGSSMPMHPNFVQAQTPETAPTTQPAQWTGHGRLYPSGTSACASFAGRGRFSGESLAGVTFHRGFQRADCLMQGKRRNGQPYYLKAASFVKCPRRYQFVGDHNKGVCVLPSAPQTGNKPDYRDTPTMGVAKPFIRGAATAYNLKRATNVLSGIRAQVSRGLKPKASDFKKWAELQGWKPTRTPNGPLKYLDENGVERLAIKRGSSRTPGSETPHVELRDANDKLIDIHGNPTTKRNPLNHTQIEYDI